MKYKKLISSLFIFSFVFLVYISNLRTINSDDTKPTKYLPVSILDYGVFYLDNFIPVINEGYYVAKSNNHYYSKYPVGTSIMALPFYGFVKFVGIKFTAETINLLEKFSATVFVSLSAIFIFLAISELFDKLIITHKKFFFYFHLVLFHLF